MSPQQRRIIDVDRYEDPDLGGSREVILETTIGPADDTTGMWVTMPVRTAIDAGGPRFEIGPYSLLPEDIVTLHSALVDHIHKFPGDFKRANGEPV